MITTYILVYMVGLKDPNLLTWLDNKSYTSYQTCMIDVLLLDKIIVDNKMEVYHIPECKRGQLVK